MKQNPGAVSFSQNSHRLKSADSRKLRSFGDRLGWEGMPAFDITLSGHASSEGEWGHNRDLSQRRAEAVRDEIVKGGAKQQPQVVPKGESGAKPTRQWRRVDISVGEFRGRPSKVILHEFGHVFGLADEYADT